MKPIPKGKICPKCNIDLWYTYTRKSGPQIGQKKWECYNCLSSRSEKNRKKNYENISDTYLKGIIQADYRDKEMYISTKDISPKEIMLRRNIIQIARKIKDMETGIKKTKTGGKVKFTPDELKTRLIELSKFTRKDFEKFPNAKKLEYWNNRRYYTKALSERTSSEDFDKFMKDLDLFPKIGSGSTYKTVDNEAQLEETIALEGVEEPVTKQESEPSVSYSSSASMDILEELKKIEERRNEILSTIQQFNDYVESLKIRT